MKEKLDLKIAKELSIKKWEYLAESGQSNLEKSTLQDELENLLSHCGICEYQLQGECAYDSLCVGCVLNTKNIKCHGIAANICCGGLFKRWQYARLESTRKRYATKILNLIKSIEV